MSQPNRRGRPIERPMSEPIPDTPENIARAILGTPPKKRDEWDYLEEEQATKGSPGKL